MDSVNIHNLTSNALRERMACVDTQLRIRDEDAVREGINDLMTTVTDIVSDQSAAFSLANSDPFAEITYEDRLSYIALAAALMPAAMFRRTVGLLFILCESLQFGAEEEPISGSELLVRMDGVLASFEMVKRCRSPPFGTTRTATSDPNKNRRCGPPLRIC